MTSNKTTYPLSQNCSSASAVLTPSSAGGMHTVPYIEADAPLDSNVLMAAATIEVNGTVVEEAE